MGAPLQRNSPLMYRKSGVHRAALRFQATPKGG